MNLGIAGKSALVTGSTAGIGLAIAQQLAAEGATVIINGRNQHRVDEAIKTIQVAVPQAKLVGIAADLGCAQGCDTLFQALPEVDILVNNVGIYEAVDFAEITDEQWQRIFDINVMSGVRLTRHYMPAMEQKHWGRVIFIASESAVHIPAEMIHYGMTKTAQVAIARGLAEATVDSGVTVNSILVGPTRSEGVNEFVSALAEQEQQTVQQVEKDFFNKVRPTSLLKRFITPEEVAHMVAYVSSELASATNGAALRVDGGAVKAIL